ncbi:hypothetical protein RDABS01_024920 [Bienertia sinuspersici]
MRCNLLIYGIDPTHNPWVSHGKSIKEIDNDEERNAGEVSDNESDDMPLDDMAPFVFDVTNAWNSINSTTLNEKERTTEGVRRLRDWNYYDNVAYQKYDALKNQTSPKVVLLKCKWFDVFSDGRRIRKDNLGSTLVNFSRTLQTNEPLDLASQIEQVFYVASHNERHWKFIIKANPHNFFDFPNDDDVE